MKRKLFSGQTSLLNFFSKINESNQSEDCMIDLKRERNKILDPGDDGVNCIIIDESLGRKTTDVSFDPTFDEKIKNENFGDSPKVAFIRSHKNNMLPPKNTNTMGTSVFSKANKKYEENKKKELVQKTTFKLPAKSKMGRTKSNDLTLLSLVKRGRPLRPIIFTQLPNMIQELPYEVIQSRIVTKKPTSR
uniref:Uncharacterized protein n=1 Tax=Parastrongyloides trichosuri TaxID=131310 RepID=A0A0N4ZKU0_PARTI